MSEARQVSPIQNHVYTTYLPYKAHLQPHEPHDVGSEELPAALDLRRGPTVPKRPAPPTEKRIASWGRGADVTATDCSFPLDAFRSRLRDYGILSRNPPKKERHHSLGFATPGFISALFDPELWAVLLALSHVIPVASQLKTCA